MRAFEACWTGDKGGGEDNSELEYVKELDRARYQDMKVRSKVEIVV